MSLPITVLLERFSVALRLLLEGLSLLCVLAGLLAILQRTLAGRRLWTRPALADHGHHLEPVPQPRTGRGAARGGARRGGVGSALMEATPDGYGAGLAGVFSGLGSAEGSASGWGSGSGSGSI